MDKSFRNLPISNNINDEEIKKQTQIRATINQLLLETGEKEKLKELLRNKLVECGWRDNMKNYCREIIKAKGVENITLEELVNELIPKGRGL
jgi:enhancer of yellow 2 transcription factor